MDFHFLSSNVEKIIKSSCIKPKTLKQSSARTVCTN